ncbi:unnamed protein product [Laminaria digitata]
MHASFSSFFSTMWQPPQAKFINEGGPGSEVPQNSRTAGRSSRIALLDEEGRPRVGATEHAEGASRGSEYYPTRNLRGRRQRPAAMASIQLPRGQSSQFHSREGRN